MARYQLGRDGTQIIEKLHGDDVRYIPVDEASHAYQEYLDWVKAGNTPDPADPLPPPDPNIEVDRDTIRGFPSRAQIGQVLDQIDTDLTALGSSPTNAQVVAILRRTLQNQKNVIQAVNALVHRYG